MRVCKRLSFSSGRRIWGVAVSSSKPIKVRRVVGQSTLSSSNGKPTLVHVEDMIARFWEHSSDLGAPKEI